MLWIPRVKIRSHDQLWDLLPDCNRIKLKAKEEFYPWRSWQLNLERKDELSMKPDVMLEQRGREQVLSHSWGGGTVPHPKYPCSVVIEASVSRPRTPNLIPEKLGDPGMLPQAGDHRPCKTQQAGPCHSSEGTRLQKVGEQKPRSNAFWNHPAHGSREVNPAVPSAVGS